MRYIRGFVILFLFIFVLVDVVPVHAVDSLFAIQGCSTDPSSTCLSPGDSANTVIPLSLTAQMIAQIVARLFGNNSGVTKTVLQGLGELKPNGAYNIGTNKLNAFANQIQTATDTDLNLADLQAIEQPDTTEKSGSMTSRACFYDQNGKLIGDGIVSNDTISTANLPSKNALIQGTQQLASFTTNYVQESQDFRQPNITINKDAALPCPSNFSGGTQVNQDQKTFQGTNNYGGTIANSTINFFANLTQDIINLLTKNGQSYTAKIVGTGNETFSPHVSALFAGCATSADMNPVAYTTESQKEGLCAAGGAANAMYRQDGINPAFNANNPNASDQKQGWILNIGGTQDTVTQANSNAFDARIENAGIYTNCTLAEADYQDKAIPGDPTACNTNWVGPGPTIDPNSTPISTPGIQGTPTPGACGTTLPNFSLTDNSCTLCHPGNITNINASFFPNGVIPPTMIQILQKVGDTYHVPPKMLLLTLFAEAGMPQYMGGATWTDDNVKNWSFCGATMPFCNTTTSAAYPYGMRADTFELYKTAVDAVDPSHTGNEKLCNFLDQTAAVAKMLSANMNMQLPADITQYSSCLGVSTATLAPTKQATSCGNWNVTDMFRERLMYMTYCPETGKSPYSPNDQMYNWTVDFFNNFQCP